MSLIWHIVRKDLRRLQLPLGLWLVLVLAHTGLLLTAGGKVEDPANPAAFEALRYFANTWGVIVSAVGFVLAAWLVMEDSLVVTTAFWPTRPISNARLLAAKALGAFLLFSVGPVLVLAPVWLGCGFSLRELAMAAWHWAAMQAVVSVAAFAIAGLTATSGQFLVRAALAVVLLPLSLAFASGKIFPPEKAISRGLDDACGKLVLGLLVVTPLVVIVHQFLTRRTARSWVLGGMGLGLMLAVRFTWGWDFSSSDVERAGAEQPEVGGIALANLQMGSLAEPGTSHSNLQGEVTGVPAQTYVRVNTSRGEWTKGRERFSFGRPVRSPGGPGRPSESLARQIAGLPASGPMPAQWTLVVNEPDGNRMEQARAAARQLAVAVNLTLMRGRVLGELPLRVGAELRAGASRTRLSRIERTDAGVVVRLEDRAAQPDPAFESFAGGPQAGPFQARLAEDVFILVNRSTGFDQVPALREVGAVQINSILVGQRELILLPPTREVNGQTVEIPGWENDAVIIQVRFLPGFTFTRPVTVDPFAPALPASHSSP